jgi:phosphoribosyl 1,2-cyclic phosphate phosphodiesterase
MSALSLEFLGTGTSQGVPVIGCGCSVCTSSNPKDQRLRTSALVRSESGTVAIDCGPDFRQQMLRAGVNQLDAVVLTHEHMDHVSGLDDLRALQFLQKRPTAIYCSERVELRLRQQFAYAFSEKPFLGAPQFELHRIQAGVPFDLAGETWMPFVVVHGTLPVLAFRIQSMVYITDASAIPDESWIHVKNARHLVLNALRIEPHYSHFHLAQALEIAQKASARNTWFTHISHHLGLHQEVDALLGPGVQLAYDGLQVSE